ncbi:glycosyltransferase family 4 protein [candidate division KSB1 bacterium]|nr:glycosyltransferase family 4 protein [candidate division KSB1 bacterium]
MKIVYFNYLYDLFGISIGSTRKAEQLMRALSEIGHDVKIYWMKKQDKYTYDVQMQERSRIKHWFSKYLHDPRQLLTNIIYIYKEWRILSREKPDLVISRLEIHLFSSLLLCRLKKIPLIIEADAPNRYELHNFCPEFYQIKWLAKWIENLNLNQAEHSICVSNVARSYFTQEGVNPEKLSVITNGADVDQFHPNINGDSVVKKYGLEDRIVIGFIGSFHVWHGIDNLLQLIRQTLKQYPNAMFLLVGQGGPMRHGLEEYIQREDLQDRVILTGYVKYEEMSIHIAAMDIVLALYPNLPLFYYSPVKVFEYMAAGKAVVATQIGQIAELVRDKENGLLCHPDDFDGMVQNLNTFIENPDLRKQLGQRAYETIQQYHSWKQKGEAWSDICEKVVKDFKF